MLDWYLRRVLNARESVIWSQLFIVASFVLAVYNLSTEHWFSLGLSVAVLIYYIFQMKDNSKELDKAEYKLKEELDKLDDDWLELRVMLNIAKRKQEARQKGRQI